MNSRPVDRCPICMEDPQAPASVAPCGHGFCFICIQRWAATSIPATCPMCRQLIMAICPLPLEDGPARMANHRRSRGLNPHARPSGQRRRRRRRQQQQQQQQQRVPRAPRRRRRSADEVEERNPAVPRQRVQRQLQHGDNNRRSRLRFLRELRLDLAWLQRVQEEEQGSGDHAGRLPLPQYRV